ncbi:MGMT family protein [Thalassotalea agariperforans]
MKKAATQINKLKTDPPSVRNSVQNNAQNSTRNSTQQSPQPSPQPSLQQCSQQNYQKIWQTVQLIPTGKVATYGQIADLAGLPGRARLVGRALGLMPKLGWHGKPIPWYRVINAQGKISLPVNSDGFITQRQLLQQEQVVVLGNKIKLAEFQWQPDITELLFRLSF